MNEKNLSQGVAKSIAGVQENDEVMSEEALATTFNPCD
jgi:hypothetical protein